MRFKLYISLFFTWFIVIQLLSTQTLGDEAISTCAHGISAQLKPTGEERQSSVQLFDAGAKTAAASSGYSWQ